MINRLFSTRSYTNTRIGIDSRGIDTSFQWFDADWYQMRSSVGGSRPGTSSSTLGGSRPGSRTGTPSGYAVNSRPTTPSGERNFGYQSPPPAPPGGGSNRKGMLSKSVLREIPSNPLRPPTPSGGQSRPHSPSTSPPRSPHTRNPLPLRQQPPRPATSQGLPPLGSEFSWVNENRPGTSSPPKGRTSDVQLTPLPISPPRARSMRQASKVSSGWVIQ